MNLDIDLVMGLSLCRKHKPYDVEFYESDLDGFEKYFNSARQMKCYRSKQDKSELILDLSMLELRRCYDNMLKQKNINILKCNGNYLTTLPISIEKLVKLKKLYAQHNNFSYFPSCICSLKNLQVINFSYNRLKSLSNGIGELHQLTSLDVGFNRISQLPESFKKLRNLINLNLESNTFHIIPINILCTLKSLRVLNLSNNLIIHLPKELAELHELKEFYVHNNRIKWMDRQLGNTIFPKLVILQINPQINPEKDERTKNLDSVSNKKARKRSKKLMNEFKTREKLSKASLKRFTDSSSLSNESPRTNLILPIIPLKGTEVDEPVKKETNDEVEIVQFYSYAFSETKETSL